jgi:hypothetical protein
MRCYINTQWITYNKTLSGNGIITNATGCSVSTTQMHTLPELHKTSETTLNTLHLYVPEKFSNVTKHETQILEQIPPEVLQQLDYVKTRVMASPRNLDIDSIVHMHQASLQQDRQLYCHLIITTVCTITIIGILCFSLRYYLYRRILPCFPTHKPQTPELQVIPSSSSTPHPGTNEATDPDPQKKVIFTTYSLQPAS